MLRSSAGADISEFRDIRQGSGGEAYDRMTAAATDALATLSKPLVAVIHGFCIGGGLALALSADIRLASDQSTFGLPPARLGIGYSPTGIGHLVDLIGPAATKELIFTADWIDADKARRWGLVNDIFPPAELDAAGGEDGGNDGRAGSTKPARSETGRCQPSCPRSTGAMTQQSMSLCAVASSRPTTRRVWQPSWQSDSPGFPVNSNGSGRHRSAAPGHSGRRRSLIAWPEQSPVSTGMHLPPTSWWHSSIDWRTTFPTQAPPAFFATCSARWDSPAIWAATIRPPTRFCIASWSDGWETRCHCRS